MFGQIWGSSEWAWPGFILQTIPAESMEPHFVQLCYGMLLWNLNLLNFVCHPGSAHFCSKAVLRCWAMKIDPSRVDLACRRMIGLGVPMEA